MRTRTALLILLTACGPQKSDTSDESSGGMTGTTGTTGMTGMTGMTGSNTEAPTTGEPLTCDLYLPPPPEVFKKVEISIVNKLAEPVWIGAQGCGNLPELRILDADAVDVFDGGGGDCSPVQCFAFIGAEDCTLGCDDCAGAPTLRIGAGSTLALNWSAARGVPMQMTAACAPGVNCERECLRTEPVPGGSYSVELTGFRQCTGACACDDPAPDLSCPLWDPSELSEPFEVKVSLLYPEDGAAQLVIE